MLGTGEMRNQKQLVSKLNDFARQHPYSMSEIVLSVTMDFSMKFLKILSVNSTSRMAITKKVTYVLGLKY